MLQLRSGPVNLHPPRFQMQALAPVSQAATNRRWILDTNSHKPTRTEMRPLTALEPRRLRSGFQPRWRGAGGAGVGGKGRQRFWPGQPLGCSSLLACAAFFLCLLLHIPFPSVSFKHLLLDLGPHPEGSYLRVLKQKAPIRIHFQLKLTFIGSRD